MSQIVDFFKKLDDNKVEYVVWKNCNLIKSFFDGKENLDIFIREENKDKFEKILKENFWIKVESTTANHRNINHYLYIDEDKIFHLHVYFRLFTGNSISKNYDLTEMYNFFQNRVFLKEYNLWIVNYELQLKLYKIRIACKQETILGNFLIKRDLNNYINEYNFLITNIKNKANLENIFDNKILKINSKIETINLLKSVSKYKRFNNLISTTFEVKFILRILFNKIFKVKKFKLKNKYFILISGADGSGKTTLINDLEKLFQKYFKTKKFNIGKPFPDFILNLYEKKKINKNQNLNTQKKVNNFLNTLKNLNLALLRFLYSLNIFYMNNNINIFLLDRYVSEFNGHINGPRINVEDNKSYYINKFSNLEKFFYNSIKPIETEFRLITSIDTCLERNRNRLKTIKETDDEIINRHKLFSFTKFKSKKIIELNNNSNKREPLLNIIRNFVTNINENY